MIELVPNELMYGAFLGQDMGIDMKLHLVDGNSLLSLLDMNWDDLVDKMNSSSLRNIRPQLDSKLERDFDIDCEADFLDLAEQISGSGTTREVLAHAHGHEVLLKLVEWASVGYWEAWEGRCYIYIENAIGREISNVEEMYSFDVWCEVNESLSKKTETEFAEQVCQDWMRRREELGETLDEKKDPRIIPTFESHDKNSRTLHYVVNQKGFIQILGRDHLDAQLWGHGEWNLTNLLDS